MTQTQSLREINFVDSRSAKTAVFAILGALNFVNRVNFSFQKSAKMQEKSKLRAEIDQMNHILSL